MNKNRCKDCKRTDVPVFFNLKSRLFLCNSCVFNRVHESAIIEDIDRDEADALFYSPIAAMGLAECGHFVRIGAIACSVCVGEI